MIQTFEWERKWLPKDLNKMLDMLDEKDVAPIRISQIYITKNDRIRETHNFAENTTQYEYTHKQKFWSGGPSIEDTSSITKEGFDKIAKAFPELRADKLRRLVVVGPKYNIFVDHLSNTVLDNRGTFLIEVEFYNQQAMRDFEVPDWFGEEVTNNPHYTSSHYKSCVIDYITIKNED